MSSAAIVLRDGELAIRPTEERDYRRLWQLIHGDSDPEWKRWDAPYLPLPSKSLDEFCHDRLQRLQTDDPIPSRWVVEIDGLVVGEVSYYWEHRPSNWLEAGIVIYDSAHWSRGVGTRALALWTDDLFRTIPDIPRVGLIAWSGNERMIRCAQKLRMQLEGRLRKCRRVEGI